MLEGRKVIVLSAAPHPINGTEKAELWIIRAVFD